MTSVLRLMISDRTMVCNNFDGGEFERLWPAARAVQTRHRSSNGFDVTPDVARQILSYVEGCPAAQGGQCFGDGTRESYAETAAVRSTAKQIRRRLLEAGEDPDLPTSAPEPQDADDGMPDAEIRSRLEDL